MRFALICSLLLAACETQPATTEVQPPVPAMPAKPAVTPQTLATTFTAYLDAINAHDLAALGGYYADDAKVSVVDSGMQFTGGAAVGTGFWKPWFVAFPDVKVEAQLTLLKDRNLTAVMQMRATHEGEFMGIPASHKKVESQGCLVISYNENGKIQSEDHYTDGAVLMAQIGAMKANKRTTFAPWPNKEVVIAAGNGVEADNVALTRKADAAFNSHDVPGMLALTSDDFVDSDVTAPTDITDRKVGEKNLKELFGAWSDLKYEASTTWAAGNYVVTVEQYTGTNTGDWKSYGIKKTGKAAHLAAAHIRQFDNGKVKKSWLFWNSVALGQQLGLIPPAGAKPKVATK